eukprot:4522140-Pyramimonas_sp.AAC.1
MVLREDMPRITDSILSSSVYLRGTCNDSVITDIVRRYHRLCRLAGAAAEDESLGPLLSRTTRRSNSHAVSVLQLTVKDHKQDGEVTCRPIHATPNFMFAGLSAWLRAVLSKKLDEVAPQLISDSHDLKDRLLCLHPDMNWHFLKIDIKDYYLCGSADEITEAVMSLWSPADPQYSYLRHVVTFFLGVQMVRDPFSGDVFHVLKGTGMGLPHSGELTDSCFAALVEITILSTSMRSRYGIKGYFRFRDDIL